MSNKSPYHTTVLLQEAIDALNIKKRAKYIDGTFGGGGHSKEIIRRGGIVLGIDQDENAIENFSKEKDDSEIRLVKGNFRDIREISEENGFSPCAGIILDLGTSVYQLKDSNLGFSFRDHASLDMRMDRNSSLTAEKIVNTWSKKELIEIFEKYGEESYSSAIAEGIINARKKKPIIYADELAEIISSVKKASSKGVNPATQVFQALRIVVNDELDALRAVLEEGIKLIEKNGRFVIISFHSLEDRIVKQKFVEFERKNLGKIITKKPVRAGSEEMEINKKSRSAKMRVFELKK